MNFKQLYYFTVIAETGSFTAAARQLELSQPPLSKQIMLLEEELGVQLMERSSRKVELTETGQFLYSRAKGILELVDSTLSDIHSLKSSPEGILKLGTISSSGNFLVHHIIREFCGHYPKIRFEITEGNTYELLEKLKNGLIECAVVRTPFNPEGFNCCYGEAEPLVAAGRPEFFASLPDEKIRLTDLVGKPLICYRRFDPIISVAFQNIGRQPNIFCRNDDARTCLIWADTGLGIALVPRSISQLPFSDSLTVREIDSGDTVTRMAAIYKKNGYCSPIARKFVEFFGETHGGCESCQN